MRDIDELLAASAAVASLAHTRAASRSATSMIQNPPRCSLVSVYGLSVIRKSPPDWRTTVADSGGSTPPWKHEHIGVLHLGVERGHVDAQPLKLLRGRFPV